MIFPLKAPFLFTISPAQDRAAAPRAVVQLRQERRWKRFKGGPPEPNFLEDERKLGIVQISHFSSIFPYFHPQPQEFTKRIAEVDSASKAVTEAICARASATVERSGGCGWRKGHVFIFSTVKFCINLPPGMRINQPT